MTTPQETGAPTLPAEPTVQNTPAPVPAVDDEKEQLSKKVIELEAQKEHWRTKYERDITNVPTNPVPLSDEVFSDEGKIILEKHVLPLQQTIESLQDKLALKDLQSQYPQLREFSTEFEDFRKEYPRHKMENIAKLFLAEKGLVEAPRNGLEKPTGGPRTPPTSGMTTEDVKLLRETNWRKYQDMLAKGLIKIEE